MYIFGERLESERKRLGWSQETMASKGGVAKRTYCNYESGDREPGAAFLQAIGEYGTDVQYILTGIRSIVENVSSDVSEAFQEGSSSVLVSSRNLMSSNAVKGTATPKKTAAYENLDVAVENLSERPSSARNLDVKEAPSPPAPAPGERLDRGRMAMAIEAVEEAFKVRKFTPAKKAKVILACYDLLGQWEGDIQSKSFLTMLQGFLKSTTQDIERID